MKIGDSEIGLTLGQLLLQLRLRYRPTPKELSNALQVSYTTYSGIERGKRELSFLMALKLCKFYKLDVHEFISMLSDTEMERQDMAVLRAREKREKAALKNANK